jgi:hypothetical protein
VRGQSRRASDRGGRPDRPAGRGPGRHLTRPGDGTAAEP